MEHQKEKQRLDEILIREGLVSEAEVKEALLRQKADGGKFGSELLYLRYIDEARLVNALAAQLDCRGVVLSNRQIPQDVIKKVPSKVALARGVIPFEFDQERNVLKIACDDPTDQSLLRELNFVVSGAQVELYVAVELALTTAIAKHYAGQNVSLDDRLLLEIPDSLTKIIEATVKRDASKSESPQETRPAILLVTDEVYAPHLIQSILERENFRVVITDSCSEAAKLLKDERFAAVLLKESVLGGEFDSVDKLRRISRTTVIRPHRSTSSLLLDSDEKLAEVDLLLGNLELFTSLLSSKAKLSHNHGARVGRYAAKLCRKLGLPESDRLFVSNAGYVHDLARYYYGEDESTDSRTITQLSVRLLKSLDYLPVVLEILRCMYVDVPDQTPLGVPLEIFGGNILTVADLFCDAIPGGGRLTLDKFDPVKKRLRDLVGRLFLAEIVEAFIEMIQEEILDLGTSRRTAQVMVYSEDPSARQLLELRLRNEGYRTVSSSSPDSLVQVYKRCDPDLIILAVPGAPQSVQSFVEKLADDGMLFERTPTFLLANATSVPSLTVLLERGIEDVLALHDDLNLLVGKIGRLQDRINASAERNSRAGPGGSGAHGRLADMNLIDLLQALGPGQKTVRIEVHPNESGARVLTLYLNQGQITFAQSGELAGADAVYEALTWTDGTWTVEPATVQDLPPPNNHYDNEAIMMEGCRRMDEKLRTGQLP